jgi:hypothetical protein
MDKRNNMVRYKVLESLAYYSTCKHQIWEDSLFHVGWSELVSFVVKTTKLRVLDVRYFWIALIR